MTNPAAEPGARRMMLCGGGPAGQQRETALGYGACVSRGPLPLPPHAPLDYYEAAASCSGRVYSPGDACAGLQGLSLGGEYAPASRGQRMMQRPQIAYMWVPVCSTAFFPTVQTPLPPQPLHYWQGRPSPQPPWVDPVRRRAASLTPRTPRAAQSAQQAPVKLMWRRKAGGEAAALDQGSCEDPCDGDGDVSESDSSDGQISCLVRRDLRRGRGAAGSAPQLCESWEWIVEEVMRDIVARLDTVHLQQCRLVCHSWRSLVDRNLQVMKPRKGKMQTIIPQFPSLTSMDLSGCQNMRNRNLSILSKSKLRLAALTVGHGSGVPIGKPRITNQAFLSIAEMKGLRSLSLCDCSAITNNGLQLLSALTGLCSLTVNRCMRISDNGLTVVRHLPLLRHLNVFGCAKVTDATLEVLVGLSQLEALHFGHTRLQDAGVRGLAALPALRELTFYGEELTNAGLADLSSIKSLTALGLSTCYQVTAARALETARAMPNLQRLNLQSFSDIMDDHLAALPLSLPLLTDLKIMLSTNISRKGLAHLKGLRQLSALSLETVPKHAHPLTLNILSALTTLTCLEVLGSTLPPMLLVAAAKLPQLAALNLSEHDPANLLLRSKRPIWHEDLGALTAAPVLRHLNLSYVFVSTIKLVELVQGLPTLEELCLHGCPVPAEYLEQLIAMFPRVHLHTKTPRTLPSSTIVHACADRALPC